MESKKAAEAEAAGAAEPPTPPASEPVAEVEAQPVVTEPEPAPAEVASGDDVDLDALIDEVLIRNRKTADPEPQEPSLHVPLARAPEMQDAAGTSTDALLEDLAFSLASDDPFVLDEAAPEPGAEGKDLEALFGAEVAGTAPVAGDPAEQAPAAPLEEDSEDAFQAELDRRARERARAALEALSESSGGESKAKPKTDEEDSDEALREIMNIPSFLRRTDD